MKTAQKTIALIASFLFAGNLYAEDDGIPPLPHAELARLLTVIKPQPNESPWREITWLTNVTEARKKAIAEDKPLVIFTAADGSPIGRT
ncbi:hypothetical protein N9A94_00640 [Akkermansiaceae bacterium]|nr:hypothetical protein [Akkermansiaceae bacterium]MDA7888137.1 hypothetical protein [Akkermansiaceae bacterium]